MSIIYGVDTEKNFNAFDVLKAVTECFTGAHLDEVNKNMDEYKRDDEEVKKVAKMHTENLIIKFFMESGRNYNNPTREDLIAVCDSLREYALNFRDKSEVEKNYEEIMSLIKKL